MCETPPPYEPPTLDDLAIIRKGGGGDTIPRERWTLRMWQHWHAQRRWWKPWTW